MPGWAHGIQDGGRSLPILSPGRRVDFRFFAGDFMRNIFKLYSFSIVFLTVIIYGLFFSFDDDGELLKISGFTMGTSYEVQFLVKSKKVIKEKIDTKVSGLLQKLDREVFSTYSPVSELSRLNQFPINTPFDSSEYLSNALILARDISELSNGAFDITIGPLVNLWGFGPDFRGNRIELPSNSQIEKEMLNIGIENLSISGNSSTVIKTKDITLDLSGIAKGYAVDEVAKLLSGLNINNYFVEIGGEIKLKGLKPGGQEWLPALEAPVYNDFQVYAVLSSLGETISLAGSGDYRNYYEVDGVHYSHAIDPRTGRPVAHNLAAAFVIDESAARADALATAFMALGPLESQEIIRENDIKALLISRLENDELQSFVSDGFSRYLSH